MSASAQRKDAQPALVPLDIEPLTPLTESVGAVDGSAEALSTRRITEQPAGMSFDRVCVEPLATDEKFCDQAT